MKTAGTHTALTAREVLATHPKGMEFSYLLDGLSVIHSLWILKPDFVHAADY